jgi:hypothetical protein
VLEKIIVGIKDNVAGQRCDGLRAVQKKEQMVRPVESWRTYSTTKSMCRVQ